MLLLSLFLACTADDDPTGASPSGGQEDTAFSAEDMILYSVDGTEEGEEITWFAGEYVEEDCPTDCSANTAPTLGAPVYSVNGVVVVGTPAPDDRDEVAAFFPFADAECNLGCGLMFHSFDSPRASSNGGGTIASNLPCDTESSGVYLGFSLNEVQVGDYELGLRVEDGCGGASDTQTGGFVVE